MSEENSAITIEVQPLSAHFPGWLQEAFVERKADELLIVYPNEPSRSQALNFLAGLGLSVDTTHHLTLGRLVDLFHLDLKLPRKLQDGPALFNVVHEMTKQAAEKGDLPLLFAPTKQNRVWRPNNTERLLALHRELMNLDAPWNWDEDPGAREFNQILRSVGSRLEGTYPTLVPKTVTTALETSPTPFTLNDVNGIILLDAAPDYTESEISFLRAVSLHKPLHHLCNPGSFRLGYHGAYIEDVPYVDQATLPEWVPRHTVISPALATKIDQKATPSIHRVQLHQRAHALDGAVDLIRHFKSTDGGTVLVIDGQASAAMDSWRARCLELGLHIGRGTEPLNAVPGINHLLRILRLGIGSEAWSMTHLRGLISHQTLPLINGAVPESEHPTKEDWAPRPHVEVLEGMARSFHVRGGPGALTRWIRTLANAEPQLGRDSEASRRALEETQWWLSSVARCWAPFIEGDDQAVLKERLVGCSSGETLQLPPVIETGEASLNHFLSCLNWNALSQRNGTYDRTLPALQLMLASHLTAKQLLQKASLKPPTTGPDFVEYLERIVSDTKLPSERASSHDVRILTPEEAHGTTADLVLLVGMDVDSWSMKLPKVPWLDAPTKLKLGMLHTDSVVRKGRHHLNHLMHAGSAVVVFDSTLEEGGGPAAPLAEWLAEAKRSGTSLMHQGAPEFLPEHAVVGVDPRRAWQYDSSEQDRHWLTPRPFTMHVVEGTVSGVRSGHRGRDERQRTGLNLRTNHAVTSEVNAIHGLAMAFETRILNDRLQRQPSFTDLENGEYFPWASRAHLVSTDALSLDPTENQAGIGTRSQSEWPHLGLRKNGNSNGVSIDPRPLPPTNLTAGVLPDVLGVQSPGVHREVWSASRLQPWLTCPRQAWVTGHLRAEGDENETEDIDHRTRGQIIHDAEAALLGAHGVPIGGMAHRPTGPLHLGSNPTPAQGWDVILTHLEQHVPWLVRNDAIATHRCRDLLGVNPELWRAHLEGEQLLVPAGRLWRLVLADYRLEHASPLACEWPVAEANGTSIEIDASNDRGQPAPFRIRGNIDRVDEVILSEEMNQKAVEANLLSPDLLGEPVDLRDPKSSGPAHRWVIIRDLKTVNGPKPGESGERHLKALFNEVQLGLYARAWELAHPGDRVVGVGVMEVGETSTHYVEIDPEIEPYLQGLSLGETTTVSRDQFRFVDDLAYESNGFRAWMYQRLQTARRAVDTAESGHIHPVPSSSCSFCKVRSICPSSILGGEAR